MRVNWIPLPFASNICREIIRTVGYYKMRKVDEYIFISTEWSSVKDAVKTADRLWASTRQFFRHCSFLLDLCFVLLWWSRSPTSLDYLAIPINDMEMVNGTKRSRDKYGTIRTERTKKQWKYLCVPYSCIKNNKCCVFCIHVVMKITKKNYTLWIWSSWMFSIW